MTLDFAQLAATVGPTAAVLMFMYLNRQPTAKEKAEDPSQKLADKLNAIEETVNAIEDRVISVQSDLNVLKDRKPR